MWESEKVHVCEINTHGIKKTIHIHAKGKESVFVNARKDVCVCGCMCTPMCESVWELLQTSTCLGHVHDYETVCTH